MPRIIRALTALALGVGLLSCADASPVAVATPHSAQRSLIGQTLGLIPALLRCDGLPYDSVSQVVGAAGGTVHIGPHTLVIPPGALAANTVITAVVSPDTVNVVRFGPQGLQFAQPAQLTLSYANCPLGGLLAPWWIAYTNDSLSILELEPTTLHLLQQTLTANIGHFSGYAVAY